MFPKGLTHAFGQKMPILSLFFLVKTSQEIRFNNVLDGKETFFDYRRKISESPKNRMFPKGLRLTHAFGQKMPILSLFGFGHNKTRIKV